MTQDWSPSMRLSSTALTVTATPAAQLLLSRVTEVGTVHSLRSELVSVRVTGVLGSLFKLIVKTAWPLGSLIIKAVGLTTIPARSLSAMVNTAVSVSSLAPLGLLRVRVRVSLPSTKLSSLMGTVKVKAVSPALKVSVPLLGV